MVRIEQVFQAEELSLVEVDETWSQEFLLKQKGMFFLKDVAGKLRINSTVIKNRYRDLEREGKDPYAHMGVRKVWNHWMIRMSTFSVYYRRHLAPVSRIPAGLDEDGVLSLDGVYWLSDVVKFLPVQSHALRYHVKKYHNPRKKIGIWKDGKRRGYLVDMPVFADFFVQYKHTRRDDKS
ncbi:MAG: hypothetical protein QNK37_34455 [Acidobacteriota bacterium]|nr:hypothetical protein [Acidobacteriota bacterium]